MILISVFQTVSLPSLPAVVVFKDRKIFTYDGETYISSSTPVLR